MSIFDLDEPKKRTPISKAEWDAKKKMMGNKCVLCGQTEKRVGGLEKAHIKAHSRDGTQYVPMCANCHKKYDRNLLTDPELKKLGLTRAAYKRLQPRKKRTPKGIFDIF